MTNQLRLLLKYIQSRKKQAEKTLKANPDNAIAKAELHLLTDLEAQAIEIAAQ